MVIYKYDIIIIIVCKNRERHYCNFLVPSPSRIIYFGPNYFKMGQSWDKIIQNRSNFIKKKELDKLSMVHWNKNSQIHLLAAWASRSKEILISKSSTISFSCYVLITLYWRRCNIMQYIIKFKVFHDMYIIYYNIDARRIIICIFIKLKFLFMAIK